MIVIMTGASHTGKTLLAQKLLEVYHYPYVSIDHLKMGLFRSGMIPLSPESDDKLITDYVWPVVKEMIKTAIENRQNLIVEGCYVPFDWQKDFEEDYLKDIKYICIVMSEGYIHNNFDSIINHASEIESRQDDTDCTMKWLIEGNRYYLSMCRQYGLPYLWIDKNFDSAKMIDRLKAIITSN